MQFAINSSNFAQNFCFHRMPYTESVILEVIRMGNVVNYAMRCTNEETTFDGYHIPKVFTSVQVIAVIAVTDALILNLGHPGNGGHGMPSKGSKSLVRSEYFPS